MLVVAMIIVIVSVTAVGMAAAIIMTFVDIMIMVPMLVALEIVRIFDPVTRKVLSAIVSGGYPDVALMRWPHPVPIVPDVVVAYWRPVSSDPDEVWAWCRGLHV